MRRADPLRTDGLEQIRSCPGDARADRAHRAAESQGRLLVGKTKKLGQHERFTSLNHKGLHDVGDWLGGGRMGSRSRPLETAEQAPLPVACPHVIGADAPGDRQEPHARRRVAPIGGEGSDRPDVRLLDEILDLPGRSERCAETPDVRLREFDQRAQRDVVSLAGRLQQALEMTVRGHGTILPRAPATRRGNRRPGIKGSFDAM